jgi:hypothetical protein
MSITITNKQAIQLAKKVKLNLKLFPLKLWKFGLQVELEHGTINPHTNVTNNDLILTAKIALAHIIEYPDYYQRLKIMEQEAKEYWKNKEKPILIT